MYKKIYQYNWQWNIQSNPFEFWPYISDTNRFNRDIQLPKVEIIKDKNLSYARRRLRFQKYGITVEWIEEPFEWVYPYTYRVTRNYIKGPFTSIIIEVILEPQKSGTRLTYKTTILPKNIIGNLAAYIQVGVMTKSQIENVIISYDKQIQKSRSFPKTPVKMTNVALQRLELLKQDLLDLKLAKDLVDRLVRYIEVGDRLELGRIRPYKLADEWGKDRRQLLELCLQSTRLGLLEFQWQLICPMCRGAKMTSQSLAGVVSTAHCDTCNLDFKTEFDKSVELTFRPNHTIRPIEFTTYCMAGPGVTTHIYCQQLLKPVEKRKIEPELKKGLYRLRIFGEIKGEPINIGKNGVHTLNLSNTTKRVQLYILETMLWSDQASTAADVTSLQVYRDLFAREALRRNEQIIVGSLTIVFTDLKGSTQLYQQIGDAVAFGLVLNHFDILKDAISKEGGSIVKTIGDAVMAVVQHPVSAVKAMIEAQYGQKEPIILKAGIHYGPCIAVNLNDRLDYFGTTVNLAARLESLSSGKDLVISDKIKKDPGVSEYLKKLRNLNVVPFTAQIKGFEGVDYKLWKVEKK